MKKIVIMIFSLVLIIALSACSQGGASDTSNSKHSNADTNEEKRSDKKALVVYYSQSGHTKELANEIQQSIDSDIFELELVDSYPDNYEQMTERVGQEQKDMATPELRKKIENMGDYDTVFIGSPIWRSSLAPPIASFLESYDLSEKTIIPFFTSDSGTTGNSVPVINELVANDVTVLDELVIQGDEVSNSQSTVNDWLSEIGF
ncbi:TPA: flavodoxin [Listeria monocytogenes]|nr:flavodoxin [Listeria monocytogenes]EAH3957114.1 flavodoxin [Listeria monocytogenes]EKA2552386.1 hypothetical protein [Listeria monocytogenes]EKA2555506.1 hypothetical protein [Listeria monocytogenes]EKA2558664.1 hypothetical protein [Listeria monocytogenes]